MLSCAPSRKMTDANQPRTQVRVLIADDSGVMLRAISRLLAEHPEIELIGEARNFEEIMRLAGELQPDVIVLDLGMARRARADALRLKARQASLLVLAISAANIDEETQALAADIGADKLLDKMQLYTSLVPTILELAKHKSS
jgi:chemotaxis response regulator CheB